MVLEPAPGGLTVVQGANGAGKTSLLEALGYCSLLRSFRGVPREAVIRQGTDQAFVACELRHGARRVDIAVEISPGRRDRAVLNRQRVDGANDLLRTLRTTLFTPDDLDLVKGGPAGRRELLDDAVAMTSARLAADRYELERVLRHRNALLRQLGGRLDSAAATTLEVWDERLAAVGGRVVAARERLVAELQPYAGDAFFAIAPSAGKLELRYLRSFAGDLASAIAAARSDDLRRQVTTVGPQRDDLELSGGGLDARTRLSQGRQRAVALAIRLATHRYVTAVTGATPVLLLDDAFSELDESTARALVLALMRVVPEGRTHGQALLTTAGSLPPEAEAELVVRMADGVLS